MTELERRVGVFAALADPTRLSIVDLLTLGDLSSSEISTELGLRSNLVAHHLRTLETVHIIDRRRSDFDRRRTYIGLRSEVFDTLAPACVRAPRRVLFVCTANSARSRLAEVIWSATSSVPVMSAGTQPAAEVNPGATASASRHGLSMNVHQRPRHIDDVISDGDLVITVCDSAHELLRSRDDLHWSIPDPATEATAAAFDSAFEVIQHRIRTLSSRLRAA